jgi:DNA-3-methyladenine glycosylase II
LNLQHSDPLTETTLVLAAKELARRDKDLAKIFKTYGPPPMWGRSRGFSTLIKIILEQQVSLASAASLFKRLRRNVVPFTPERMIELDELHLRTQGLTRQKAAYCVHLSQAIVEKRLDLRKLSRMNDADARVMLTGVKGLGLWSADVYLLMAMRRADIWPSDDLALAVAWTQIRRMKTRLKAAELTQIAEAWRPYRSVAARMLWQYYLAERDRAKRSTN